MASTYSALKIELIATGEQSGTWGATTNVNLGDAALGEAITGSADVAFSSADVTITLTDTNATQTARNLRLNLTGTSGGARNLILGSGCQIEKLYLVNNGLADAVTVKNTTGTGIAVAAGKSMFVYNNGTNVVEAVNYADSIATGAITCTSLTDSGLTSGRVTYAGASGLLTDSSTFVFNGTNLGVGVSSTTSKMQVYGGAGIGGVGICNGGLSANSYAADTHTFTTGNGTIQGIYQDSSANVGIGTASPTQKLHITSASDTNIRLTNAVATSGLYIGVNASSYGYMSILDNQPLWFGTNNTERLRITAAGNVGIGISSPSSKLELYEAAGVTLKLTATTGSSFTTFGNTGGNFFVGKENSSGSTFGAPAYASVLYEQAANPVIVYTNSQERMRITSAGDLSMASTNAITSSRINPRTSSTASTATLTPDISANDQYNLTAQAVGLTIAAPTGTPVDGNKLMIRILDNGTSQTISWNATYTAIGVTLPTATTVSKMTYVGCIYNSTNTRWDVIAVTTQA